MNRHFQRFVPSTMSLEMYLTKRVGRERLINLITITGAPAFLSGTQFDIEDTETGVRTPGPTTAATQSATSGLIDGGLILHPSPALDLYPNAGSFVSQVVMLPPDPPGATIDRVEAVYCVSADSPGFGAPPAPDQLSIAFAGCDPKNGFSLTSLQAAAGLNIWFQNISVAPIVAGRLVISMSYTRYGLQPSTNNPAFLTFVLGPYQRVIWLNQTEAALIIDKERSACYEA